MELVRLIKIVFNTELKFLYILCATTDIKSRMWAVYNA